MIDRTTLTWSAGDDRIKVFPDLAGEWRWHRKAKNGEIISDSGEGYGSISDAARAARRANPDSNKSVGPRRPRGTA